MARSHKTLAVGHDRKGTGGARGASVARRFAGPRPVHVVSHDGMTEAQKRIVDSAERPGTVIPAGMTDEDLMARLLATCE